MAPYSRYFAAVFQLILTPILALIVAGLAFAVFNAALGGDATLQAGASPSSCIPAPS